ncbi:hypothetical protein CWO85_01275 [Candidatus Phytoplasma ziziphi]|uniref:Uncharacterized protein n=1 Tax=Ziziphus jujuba witches'-broom phytoplasma TaxID=135727 RepID=A0A660HMA9_ZIZJU|nr:hypothetical protein [Candidatus Phytoplasma ziziphi]AYJ01163.1 hypothetical protein CWO85_01275 [Candidatus Phytoplasma ziziphi]
MNYYYLGINFVVGCLALYIIIKTKYLDFMINPSNKFYKQNFKTYINNHYDQKQNKFIHKNIDKINQSKENIFQKNKSKTVISHKSVFYRLYSLIGILILSTNIAIYFLLSCQKDKLCNIWFLTIVVIFLFYFIRFLFYCFVDVYFFSSWICLLFSLFLAIAWGVYFACLYLVEYKLLTTQFVKSNLSQIILKYFLLLFVLLPFLISFIVIFFVSYLYRANKIKVNTKFHIWLKKLFIISFFSATSFLSYILSSNNLIVLLLGLLESLFYLILYSLVWINTLNQLDRFIEQKIPKKCEWLLVWFLFEAFVMIFLAILVIIIRIVNYFVEKIK